MQLKARRAPRTILGPGQVRPETEVGVLLLTGGKHPLLRRVGYKDAIDVVCKGATLRRPFINRSFSLSVSSFYLY